MKPQTSNCVCRTTVSGNPCTFAAIEAFEQVARVFHPHADRIAHPLDDALIAAHAPGAAKRNPALWQVPFPHGIPPFS